MLKAYSYVRFSTPEQARGDSSRRQTALARDYALRHGLDLDEGLSYQDLGVSAFRGRNAETGRLGEFLEAVRDSVVPTGSYLLVESLDRISRQSARKAIRVLESIIEYGITLVTLNDGKSYTTKSIDADPMSFVLAVMIFVRSNEESATKSRRLKASWERKRADAATKPISARAPLWLELMPDRVWRVRDERADVVRRVFELAAGGAGENLIAATLNREGVAPFGPGAHWHRTSVIRLLDNPAVAGTMVPHVQEHVEGRKVRRAQEPVLGYFPAIVVPQTYEAVRALRADGGTNPQRGRHAGTTLQNVFGGLARCPICDGAAIRVAKGVRSRPFLVCAAAKVGAGCRYRAVPLAPLEAALAANLVPLLSSGGAGADPAAFERDMAAVRVEIGRLETKAAGLAEVIAMEPGSATLRRALGAVEAEIDATRDHLREIAAMADASDGRSVQRYASELREAFGPEIDRQRANVAMRKLFVAVVTDYLRAVLVLRWRGGRETAIRFADSELLENVPSQWRDHAETVMGQPLGQEIAPGVFVRENSPVDRLLRGRNRSKEVDRRAN